MIQTEAESPLEDRRRLRMTTLFSATRLIAVIPKRLFEKRVHFRLCDRENRFDRLKEAHRMLEEAPVGLDLHHEISPHQNR